MTNKALKIGSLKDIKKIVLANYPLFFIIAILIFVTFINGINGEFISDDIPGILNYEKVTNFGEALKSLQIQIILQGAIYAMFGPNQVAFHTFSMIMHFVNVILFFVIVYNLFGKKVAAIASLLYSIHPVTVEAVVWMSALNYLINTFILHISTILYLFYKKTDDKKYLALLFVYFGASALTFSNFWIFIIPFYLVALDFFLLQKKNNFKPILHLIPIFVMSALIFYFIGESRVLDRVSSLNTQDATPYLNRVPYSIYMAGELLVWPQTLTLYHEGEIITQFKYTMMFILAGLIVASFFVAWKKNKRTYAGLIALVAASLLPVFSPVQVAWFVAERYMYVATGVYAIMLSMFILWMDKKWKGNGIVFIVTALLLIGYSARSIARTFEWKTRKTLWEATERTSPFSARVHNNLGDVYGLEQDWDRSIGHFLRAIEIKPTYGEAIHNLGNTYLQIGQLENAELALLKSLEVNPVLYQSMHKLGLIYYNTGDFERSKFYFAKSLEIEPNYLPAIQALQILQQRSQ